MRKTRFRMGGMVVCLFLAVMTAMPVVILPTPAYSQATGGIGQTIANGLASGQTPAQLATTLAGQGGGATVQQWTTILTGLQNNGATVSAITGLVNGVTGGLIPPNIANTLSMVSQLGNINSISDLTNLLNNPMIQNTLNSLGTVGQMAGSLQAILDIAQNPANLLNPANIAQLAQTITNLFPSLANALGGLSGVTAALGGIGGLLGGLLGGAAGSGQNPMDSTFTDAGCNCQSCNTHIPAHYQVVRVHTQDAFIQHRTWLINTFWRQNILPALQLMAAQLTAVGIAQIQMIGAMLDAKHQLETQRIFQQMTAQAHKDYQPSEGMCTFGTTVRSLAGSERRSNLAQMAFAQRMNQRQTLSGDVLSTEGLDSDRRSRLQHFIANYCDQADNANGLGRLCQASVPNPARRNIDVDYTRNIESRLTLDMDFTAAGAATPTEDEQDVFALSANLFANKIASAAAPENLAAQDGRIRLSNVEKYMDLRSIFAKRSVAQNSFAAITAQRAAGAPKSAPYTKAVLRELGVTSDAEINQLLGNNPSYFAQMEVLTKKLYQNPTFYTELYDKPVNIERKGAALQAIGLMQDRDLYNSLLRSEVVLSVLLETMLQREQDKVMNEGPKRNPAAGAR